MSRLRVYADVVVGIPLPSGTKKWQKVGVLLKYDEDQNDVSKGPGFSIMLDKTFNPAGIMDTSTSVSLSVFWPKEKEGQGVGARPTPRDAGMDNNDIPF